MNQIDVIRNLRDQSVKISVLKMAEDDNQNYFTFLTFNKFHDVKNTIEKYRAFQIVFNKAPVPKP